MIVTQDTGVVVDHAQPAWVVTVRVAEPPMTPALIVVGLTVYEHAAAWFTVKVVPAMVRVPERVVVAVFAAMVNPVEPEPVPDAPLLIVIHDAPLVAVQAQPAVVVTVDEPVPPEAAADWLVGEIE